MMLMIAHSSSMTKRFPFILFYINTTFRCFYYAIMKRIQCQYHIYIYPKAQPEAIHTQRNSSHCSHLSNREIIFLSFLFLPFWYFVDYSNLIKLSVVFACIVWCLKKTRKAKSLHWLHCTVGFRPICI